MFVAKRENGQLLHLLHSWNEKQLRMIREKERFFCPVCHLEVGLRIGKQNRWHFAHKKSDNCLIDFERESSYHMRGKVQLYRWFQSQNLQVEVERYLPRIKQRPDLFVTIENRKFAIEYQCATLSNEEWLKRTKSYWKEGIQILWILGGNQLKRRHAYWLSLSSFHSLCTQFYPHPYLLYFCSNEKAFFKGSPLIPFSSSIVFSHLIHFPLRSTTFPSLLEHSTLSIGALKKEWLQKKRYLRSNSLQIWKYSQRSFLHLLYKKQIPPSHFPPEIGVPLPSSLSFQTHPFLWQAYIVLELLESLAIGEYISLHTVFQYVARHKGIRLRQLPYFPKNFWEEAVKEYMRFLCMIGQVEEVSLYKYRKKRSFSIVKMEVEISNLDEEMVCAALFLFESKYNMIDGKKDIIERCEEGIT
ncbi:competence protein CoiA [Bacillus manliponensis]|uniref:competence protein CoiA n=1 Tax=Bacillus manliponensis TaxID=574376 RepID=UPI00351899EC